LGIVVNAVDFHSRGSYHYGYSPEATKSYYNDGPSS
jgi:hypothetical protein